MKDDSDKHIIIGNIGNKGNKLIDTVEPNLNIYSNDIINFAKPFTNITKEKRLDFI